MSWVLVLLAFSTGMAVVPREYSTEAACKEAGEIFKRESGPRAYTCIPGTQKVAQ